MEMQAGRKRVVWSFVFITLILFGVFLYQRFHSDSMEGAKLIFARKGALTDGAIYPEGNRAQVARIDDGGLSQHR